MISLKYFFGLTKSFIQDFLPEIFGERALIWPIYWKFWCIMRNNIKSTYSLWRKRSHNYLLLTEQLIIQKVRTVECMFLKEIKSLDLDFFFHKKLLVIWVLLYKKTYISPQTWWIMKTFCIKSIKISILSFKFFL